MILIADSGSTKCDWAHISNDGQVKKFQSHGLNPQVQSESFIRTTLNTMEGFEGIYDQVQHIYLYTSGCSTPGHELFLRTLLEEHFKDALTIEVRNDLYGAARAALGDNSGYIGILGTGSNLAYYNGEKLSFKTPALGYVMGDEGSGSNIGKELIKKYLYHQLPENLHEEFKKFFGLKKDEILSNLYNEERPNAFLASAFPFAVTWKDDPTILSIIQESIRAYITNHIMAYKEVKEVHFVGSVALLLRDELEAVLKEFKIRLGSVISQPIDELIAYHRRNSA